MRYDPELLQIVLFWWWVNSNDFTKKHLFFFIFGSWGKFFTCLFYKSLVSKLYFCSTYFYLRLFLTAPRTKIILFISALQTIQSITWSSLLEINWFNKIVLRAGICRSLIDPEKILSHKQILAGWLKILNWNSQRSL